MTDNNIKYKYKYLKYKNKYLNLKKQIGGINNLIQSIGFELQSPNLFTVLFRYNQSNILTARYASVVDIPESNPIQFFSSNGYNYQLTLDDHGIQPQQPNEALVYLERLEIPYATIVSEQPPTDTEFTTLNTNFESILEFVHDPTDYTDVLVTNFRLVCAYLIYYIRENFTKEEYVTKQNKHNTLYTPKSHNFLGRFFGFYHAGFVNPSDPSTLSDSKNIYIVPQVTFSCKLEFAYAILKHLLANTKENEHMESIRLIDDKITSLNITNDIIKSLGFLILYYDYIMKIYKTKQMLGFVIRHKLKDIIALLNQEIKQEFLQLLIQQNVNIDQIDNWENSDDVNKFPPSPSSPILIEYRLFGYIVSEQPNDNSISIVI